jgi:hypothetical protein
MGKIKTKRMRQLISSAFIILIISACSSSKLISKHELERKNYQEVIGVFDDNKPKPDKYAMYPNGLKGIYEHIAKTTKYPSNAIKNNIHDFSIHIFYRTRSLVLIPYSKYSSPDDTSFR